MRPAQAETRRHGHRLIDHRANQRQAVGGHAPHPDIPMQLRWVQPRQRLRLLRLHACQPLQVGGVIAGALGQIRIARLER